VPDFNRQELRFAASDVRRIADNEVEQRSAGRAALLPAVPPPFRAEGFEPVGFEEVDALGKAVTGGVAAGDVESRFRNIGGVNGGRGKFLRQRDGDAAGARADVDQRDAFTRSAGRAAGPNLADREAVKGDFDEMLGFRARNQDLRRDLEFEPPEFLFASEVLRGLARRPPGNQREIRLGDRFR